ncbi:TolC family protein [Maricaulis maris]|uniref:Outer membrane protein TolC n=1 Tax=Maricaulis maris TaxID=74318 RepID=A0A495DNX5_9PROT|nr:TolC family protein [Maricaulis maris]RKR03729.1 outer membrane protein TolC [Maricaulis maris]
MGFDRFHLVLGRALSGLCLVVTAPAAAFAAQPETCLSFEHALRIAAERAPEVAGAIARQDEAAADYREAESLRLPQLSTFGRTASGDSGLTGSQIENQVGLRLSQRLWDFGDSHYAMAAASSSIEQRAHELRAQQIDASGRLADAYLTHLEADAMINVVAERRDYFERQRAAVQSLLTTGGATRADRAQIEARLAEAEADALELGFMRDRAATRIREYTGFAPDALCGAEAAEQDLARALRGIETVHDAVDHTLTRNPGIAAQAEAVRGLDAQRERARRSRLPVIEAVGIASWVYDDFSETWDARDRVGIDLSVPLLTGEALQARGERAVARMEQQESGLRSLQRELREQAEIVFRRSISLQAQLVRREAVARSQYEYFDAISGEFEFGLGTLPDLVDARLTYERAELDVIGARFSLLRQKLELMGLTARMPEPRADAGRLTSVP